MKNNINNNEGVPFTARLLAYYRAQETKKENSLFKDPFAELLAGDLTSYFKKDQRFAVNDYPLIRSLFVDTHLLTNWCREHKNSQIVILGAGLDTRAYRFRSLTKGEHTIYEIDYQVINDYKENLLKNKTLLCDLKRVSADLSDPKWINQLIEAGFSKEIPVFWLLEGLVYYMEQASASILLNSITELSPNNSQFFIDICDPVCAEVDFGPFFAHFKWGLVKEDISAFFTQRGWKMSIFNAEDYDHGRFVGPGLMTFVHGIHT